MPRFEPLHALHRRLLILSHVFIPGLRELSKLLILLPLYLPVLLFLSPLHGRALSFKLPFLDRFEMGARSLGVSVVQLFVRYAAEGIQQAIAII